MQIVLKHIDYILINKKWINSRLNCESYSSFEGVSSNHRIITTNIRLSLCRYTEQTAKTLLKNRDIINRYTIILRNKFNALQEISKILTLNDKYENFVNTHIEATAEYILTKLKNQT